MDLGLRGLHAIVTGGTKGIGRRAADIYQGTLSMFEQAGFEVVEHRQWNASTPVRPIVRLALAGRE